MRKNKSSEDVASEPYIARVDDANDMYLEKKLNQFCVQKIGGGTFTSVFFVPYV